MLTLQYQDETQLRDSINSLKTQLRYSKRRVSHPVYF